MLERVAYGEDEVPALLGRLSRLAPLREAVVLSTCNRTEIYATCDASADLDRLGRFLALDRRVGWDELRSALVTETGQDAVRHLFRVAAGLESMAVGEAEIQVQVRAAHGNAQEAGTVAGKLDAAFRWALRAGRRVRQETALGTVGRSLGRSAVEAGAAALGTLGRTVLVLGAGKIARAVTERARGEGAHLRVWSRTEAHAERLAGSAEGVLPWAQLQRGLVQADLVICCCAAPPPLLAGAEIGRAMAARKGRPLTIVDLSVPRNVDPAARQVPGVRLMDLDALGRNSPQTVSRWPPPFGRADRGGGGGPVHVLGSQPASRGGHGLSPLSSRGVVQPGAGTRPWGTGERRSGNRPGGASPRHGQAAAPAHGPRQGGRCIGRRRPHPRPAQALRPRGSASGRLEAAIVTAPSRGLFEQQLVLWTGRLSPSARWRLRSQEMAGPRWGRADPTGPLRPGAPAFPAGP